VVGELARRLGLVPALDRAIDGAARIGGLGPVKQRARGCSPGQLLVVISDSMLCGGDSMLDLERLRADEAGAELPAVAEVPAASTACQLARRYRRVHLRAAEAAFAACANSFDRPQCGRGAGDAGFRLDGRSRSTGGASPGRRSTTKVSSPTSRWSARGRKAAGCFRPSSSRAMSHRCCCGAHWTICPTAMARSPRDSTPAFTALLCCRIAERAGCASRSRCRARARCGRRSGGSPRTPGSLPTGSRTPRRPRRRMCPSGASISRCG
jgi:hypothetical protein